MKINLVEHEKKMKEKSEKYKIVVDENENLRIGMHEILEKLREYDGKCLMLVRTSFIFLCISANSDHITIDTSTLEKLLYALDARSISGWYHPAMRMQSELMITKEREIALREKIKINEKSLADKIRLNSIEKDVSLEHLEPVTDAPCDQLCLEKATEITQLREQLAAIDTKHNELVIENDELKITERQYTDLVESLKQSDSEQEKLLIEKIEKLNEIEVNACKYKRKLEYFKMENDSVNELVRTLQTDNLHTIFELKKEVTNKNTELQRLRSAKSGSHENGAPHKTDFQNILGENAGLRQQLSQLSSKFYKNFKQINQGVNLVDGKDADALETVVLVDDNLGTEFFSKSSFEEMKRSLDETVQELVSLKMEKKHLEELLAVANEQVRLQQGMLTRSSDDEIELRHLIADLQSTSNEKYLLVKKQKELDAGE
jgi:centrosomal protein CEP290